MNTCSYNIVFIVCCVLAITSETPGLTGEAQRLCTKSQVSSIMHICFTVYFIILLKHVPSSIIVISF